MLVFHHVLAHLVIQRHLRVFKIAVRRQQNHLDMRVEPVHRLHQLYAVHKRHFDIGEDDVRKAARDHLEAFPPVAGGAHHLYAVFLPFNTLLHPRTDDLVVVDNQQLMHETSFLLRAGKRNHDARLGINTLYTFKYDAGLLPKVKP